MLEELNKHFSKAETQMTNRYRKCYNTQHEGNANQNHKELDFLVVQWLRIHLPMQGTRDQTLICKTNKPVHHNY